MLYIGINQNNHFSLQIKIIFFPKEDLYTLVYKELNTLVYVSIYYNSYIQRKKNSYLPIFLFKLLILLVT